MDQLILSAVLDGLDDLLERPQMLDIIKQIDLPYYECRPCDAERLENFKSKYAIEVSFSTNDALKYSSTKGLIVSTTNCGDNHAVCGKFIAEYSPIRSSLTLLCFQAMKWIFSVWTLRLQKI